MYFKYFYNKMSNSYYGNETKDEKFSAIYFLTFILFKNYYSKCECPTISTMYM